MNPSRMGQLPYTYVAMTNFVCENCIGKWCRVTITLRTSELNKVTGWLCEILPTGQSRVLTKCSAVRGPSAQKPVSDPATNVVCIRQAKKQLNNPNKDLAVPDATTAWKEARAAWLDKYFCQTRPGACVLLTPLLNVCLLAATAVIEETHIYPCCLPI